MNNTNLIYGLRDPRNDVYKYIGKTTIGNDRPLRHLIKSHNKYVNEWVEELSKLGLTPFVDIIERDIDLELLSIVEKKYIVYYSSINPLFNGGETLVETINEPSAFDNADIDTTFNVLTNTFEAYKIIKISTGFTDDMIAAMLGVERKTVHNIKQGVDSITLYTIIKLLFFCKYKITDVFEFYMKNSNEFVGDWPDTYKDFECRCHCDRKFTKTWFDKFYKMSVISNKKAKYV
jgi:plasmid maintenance system antidote protein VapI